ncbi:MAG: hypothetical protein KDA86_21935 [Planctomycetaceae bacterium]|nr:hypothetical protein [Planctomycetaceae bacterium]MCA9108802.1 hypothetical protein [Planctomycetaceae bacterium]
MEKIDQTFLWKLLDASVWHVIGLLVALVVLVGLIIRVRTLFREDEDSTADDHRLLTQITDLHREGDLTEEEYRSIKGRLVQKLDEQLKNNE